MDDQTTRSTAQAVGDATRSVADGISGAAINASSAVRQASDGITRIRAAVRQQPITAAFLFLTMGYILGSRLAGGRH